MPADLIVADANILTLAEGWDELRPEALAVGDGKILALGRLGDLEPLKGPRTKVVSLGGRTVLPAFVDGHGHFMETGRTLAFQLNLKPPPLGPAGTLTELKAQVARRAAQTPPGEWLVGHGYDDTALAEGRHPLAADLDEAAPRHPTALTHVSGHFLAVNSLALELAGLTAATLDPPGGRLRRRPDGRPDGLLEEASAMALVEKLIPPPGLEERLIALRAAQRVWAARGAGTAQDGWTETADGQALRTAWERGELRLRVQILPGPGRFDLTELRGRPPGARLTPDGRLSLGPAKLFADGSIQGYTGHLTNPYHKLIYAQHGPLWRGYAQTDPQELAEQVAALHAQGFQIAVHANGDAAIDDVLDAYETAQKRRPRADARHLIIHCQTVREDQLDRLVRLGVYPSFFAVHVHWWGDRHRDVFLGPERAARLNPLQSARLRGLIFSLHNDSPITPFNPLFSASVAVRRLTGGGAPLGPEQRLAPLEAFKALTGWAARLAHQEDRIGVLKPGLSADLAVLDGTLSLEEPASWPELKIAATLVGGETIWGGLD
jgi:predicted amidohydrolase YtcJ